MADATIKQSGGDFTSMNGFIGDAGTSATDTGTVTGTWTVKDTTDVTWNKAVFIVADSDSKQIGVPWGSGDTHYQLHGDGAGHVITCTADVDITDIDIQSQSGATSDEIFRLTSACSVDLTRCVIGFDGDADQQDVIYTNSWISTETITLEQCIFYDIGRSVVDIYQLQTGNITVDINSCSGYNLSNFGGRSNGAWVGVGSPQSGQTVTINAHSCLLWVANSSGDGAFGRNGVDGTFDVSATYCITNRTSVEFIQNGGTTTTTGTVYEYAWSDSADPGAGDYVVHLDITTAPYDLRLTDVANNDAQDFHTTGTGSGLTIPSTDILGTSRPDNTSYEVGAYEVGTAVPGGGHPWFYRWQNSLLSLPLVAALLMGNPPSSRRGFLKSFPFWWIKK